MSHPPCVGRVRHLRRRAGALAFVAALAVGLVVAGPDSRSGVQRQADAATTAVSFTASEDAYVSRLEPRANFNTERLAASSKVGDLKITYLTFRVAGVPAGAAGVRAEIVLTRDLHHLPGSVELSQVPSTQWNERSLTMLTAPEVGRRLGIVHPGGEDLEVRFALPGRALAGNGVYSFAVTSAATDDVARFRSAEFGSGGPLLSVTYDGQPVDPPPGGGDLSDTWTGAAASAPIAGGGIDYGMGVFQASNAAIGPHRFRRSFDSSLPTSFGTSAAAADAANGFRSFVSWKPPNGDFRGAAAGVYDAQVTAWAVSVPRTGIYATSFHEPENDMNGPEFVALQQHLYTVVKAANPTIQWGPVYMAYWWDDGTSHYVGDKDAWWPGAAYADFTAVDVYSNSARPLETHSEFRGWYDYMLGVGKPMLIAEYGQYVVPPGGTADPAGLAQRADVIAQDAAWLAEEGTISMWLYWDAMGSKGDWRLQDPASQQAWRAVSVSGRVR